MKFKRHNNYITTLAVKYINQKFAHAQTQYIPLAVVKVADVLFDVVRGVGTVVDGNSGSFAVKMRNVNKMSKLYVINKRKKNYVDLK